MVLGTVARAGKALDLFTPERPVWGATAVARELGIAKSQAHELLVSLTEIGLLRRQPGGQYRLGWRALSLGRDVLRGQFPGAALRAARAVSARYRLPVHLVTLDRDRLTVIARYSPPSPTEPLLPSDLAPYLHCCAMGRCLIAELPEARLDAVLEAPLRAFTPATLVTRDALVEELDRVRSARVAIDAGEIRGDLRAVAAPVRNAEGDTIAALGLWTTAARWERSQHELTRAMEGTARRMEEAIRSGPATTPALPAAA
jgi:IclR family KDG regulon transcriptional repressor